MYPNIKFIVLLRNPIDRAYSQYNFVKYSDRTPAKDDLSFEEAIDRENARVKITDSEDFDYNYKHYSYTLKGHYFEQLKRWFEKFPRENFLIINSEDFFMNTKDILIESANFLGIKMTIPEDGVFKVHNKNLHEEMAPETREMLRNYYQPHNDKLFKLLGKTFNWD